MKTIKLSSIKIPTNRQRQEFDIAQLNELGESIKKNGLFHPVVLRFGDIRQMEDPTERYLSSGERRIRAVTDIFALGDTFKHDREDVPEGEIPYVDIGDLTELERIEAEYDENSKRANLTWQEDAAAVRRFAEAKAKYEGKNTTSAEIIREVTLKKPIDIKETETGKLGWNQENTRRQVIVAKHLNNPEVKSAKSVDEAFKILKRQEETQRRVDLAASVGRTYSAETAHRALNEDSIAWMQKCAAESFDVICTDPIFGINADEFGDSGGHTQGAHQYKDDYETWKLHAHALSKEGFRICKSQAHLYAFCDITRFAEFKEILKSAGWDCFRTPITWFYPNGNRTPWVDGGPQRKHGWILYARKGGKPVTRIYPDLVSYTADQNLGHNAQKPVALFVDLLRRSVGPGDSVLDPFAGSGTILPAAHELKCKATAIEIDPKSYGLCIGRLDTLKEAPELTGL